MIVGYTTGVYDMFHIGHLNILKQAKANCDFLIVGVTTDELCIDVKNKKPIIPFNDRIEIIKSIKFVDKAVPQKSMNKMQAWNSLGFNRMFVGDDWKEKWSSIEKEFKKVNVDIMYFPYTKKISSTILRKEIKGI